MSVQESQVGCASGSGARTVEAFARLPDEEFAQSSSALSSIKAKAGLSEQIGFGSEESLEVETCSDAV